MLISIKKSDTSNNKNFTANFTAFASQFLGPGWPIHSTDPTQVSMIKRFHCDLVLLGMSREFPFYVPEAHVETTTFHFVVFSVACVFLLDVRSTPFKIKQISYLRFSFFMFLSIEDYSFWATIILLTRTIPSTWWFSTTFNLQPMF